MLTLSLARQSIRESLRQKSFTLFAITLFTVQYFLPHYLFDNESLCSALKLQLKYQLFFSLIFCAAMTLSSSSLNIAEDIHSHRLQLLHCKPISHWRIILGKALGSFILSAVALSISLIWLFSSIDSQYQNRRTQIIQSAGEYLKYCDLNLPRKTIQEPIFNSHLIEAKRLFVALTKRQEREKIYRLKKVELVREESLLSMVQSTIIKLRDLELTNSQFYQARQSFLPAEEKSSYRIPKGESIDWSFPLPKEKTSLATLRYRLYSESFNNKQTEYHITLQLYDPLSNSFSPPLKQRGFTRQNEDISLALKPFKDQPTIKVRLTHLGPSTEALLLRHSESPRLLIGQESFFNNFIRYASLSLLLLFCISLLGAMAGALFQPQMALLLTSLYFLISFILNQSFYLQTEQSSNIDHFHSLLSYLFIDLNKLFPISQILQAELITYAQMSKVILSEFIAKILPLSFIALLLFKNRELAAVTKNE